MSVKLTEIIFLPWDLLVVENRTLEQLSRSQTTLGSIVWGRDFVQSAEKLGGAGSEARGICVLRCNEVSVMQFDSQSNGLITR